MRISDWSSDVCSSDLKFGSRKRKSAKSRPSAIAKLQNWLSEKPLNVRQKPIVWRRSRKLLLRPSGRKEKPRKHGLPRFKIPNRIMQTGFLSDQLLKMHLIQEFPPFHPSNPGNA